MKRPPQDGMVGFSGKPCPHESLGPSSSFSFCRWARNRGTSPTTRRDRKVKGEADWQRPKKGSQTPGARVKKYTHGNRDSFIDGVGYSAGGHVDIKPMKTSGPAKNESLIIGMEKRVLQNGFIARERGANAPSRGGRTKLSNTSRQDRKSSFFRAFPPLAEKLISNPSKR
jgi:hypothetical protein